MKGQNKKEAIIIIGMILVAVALIFIMKGAMGGTKVVVTVGGEEYGVYDLYKDTEVEIKSAKGINVLKIENGQASIISADCPDKICVNTYPISEETPGIIVCLPHEVIVELRDK